MGGSTFGDFGKTRGSNEENHVTGESVLDAISNFLTLASLIPGIDTFTDLAAIPIDLLRGDFTSAGLDAIGVIPFVGEIADTAKLAKVADKAVDVAKSTKKVSKVTSIADNAKSVAKKYNLSKNGYFGIKGKNTQIFKSADPVKSSSDFYKKISNGGYKTILSNGKGVQTIFPDGSRVVYRVITKTPDSPAVSITVTNSKNIKSQKIHFIK